MRIVFIGAVEFSRYLLRELIQMQADIVGVCASKRSEFNSDHVDISDLAKTANIPFCHVSDINDPIVLDWISDRNPDVIFCFGWSHLIQNSVLQISRLGVLGYHPSELPKNRGRHPIIWALALDLSETASTFFFMNEYSDAGDILSQEKVFITADDDAGTLYMRLVNTASKQLREFVPLLAAGEFTVFPQETSKSNIWRKRKESDGFIDWRMSANAIHNLVRGLAKPYVGASFSYEGQTIKVWKTEVEPCTIRNIEPGKILDVKSKGVLVKAGSDAIWLCDCTPKRNLKVGRYL